MVSLDQIRQNIDREFHSNFGPLRADYMEFHERFFQAVPNNASISKEVLKKCKRGRSPVLGKNGWADWPDDPNQIVQWWSKLVLKLHQLAYKNGSDFIHKAIICNPIDSITNYPENDNTMVMVNVIHDDIRGDAKVILVGGLRRDKSDTMHCKLKLDVAKFARRTMTGHQPRRFVLGFTLHEFHLRTWIFDRAGSVSSDQFDINKEPLRFISTMLGFLRMTRTDLGFDPTVEARDDGIAFKVDRRHCNIMYFPIIQRLNHSFRLTGRGMTCWLARLEGDPDNLYIVKDMWEDASEQPEGEILREVTEKGVINVARCLLYYTVHVDDRPGYVWDSVRRGTMRPTRVLKNGQSGSSTMPPVGVANSARPETHNMAAKKRLSSQIEASWPDAKRQYNVAFHGKDRVHRRIVLRDYGSPIYFAQSHLALLHALEGCIEGHESLYRAGYLHRGISPRCMMINQHANNPSLPSFLTELDKAIKVEHIGTRRVKRLSIRSNLFVAIGALLGEPDSLRHDLESFFWSLFFICARFVAPGEDSRTHRYDVWAKMDSEQLASIKKGMVVDERDFLTEAKEHFTPYYRPLIYCVNQLRKVVFPNGARQEYDDLTVYEQMKEVLRYTRRHLETASE